MTASACIYRVPSRPAWNTRYTLLQFNLTAGILGPLFAAAVTGGNLLWLVTGTAVMAGAQAVLLAVRLLRCISSDSLELRGTARLLVGPRRAQSIPVFLRNLRDHMAIALAQVEGPRAGIAELEEIRAHPQLRDYHLLDATLGELYRRAGDLPRALEHLEAAWRQARTPQDRQLLERRMALCRPPA